MSIGRNAPCPCGSGKKYKKCCLEKDQPAGISHYKKAKNVEPDRLFKKDIRDNIPQSTEKTNYELFWEEYESLNTENQFILTRKIISDPSFDNSDFYIDLFIDLYDKSHDLITAKKYIQLVEFIRDNNSQLFNKIAAHLLANCVLLCLAHGLDKVSAYFLKLADVADKVPDSFFRITDHLGYLGHLELLQQGFEKGWETVKNSSSMMSWAVNDFYLLAIDYTILDYIKTRYIFFGIEIIMQKFGILKQIGNILSTLKFYKSIYNYKI